MTNRTRLLVVTAICVMLDAGAAAGQSAASLYAAAHSREEALRSDRRGSTIDEFRAGIASYERIVRRYPRSGYCDNALWQAAALAFDAFDRFGDAADRRRALRYLHWLQREYPSSRLAVAARERVANLEAASATPAAPRTPDAPVARPAEAPAAPEPASSPADAPDSTVTIRAVKRTRLPEVVRVTIEMDAEVPHREERIDNPSRLFFDLPGTKTAPPLLDASLSFEDDVVRSIRLGRHPNHTTRIVLDLDGVSRYSVFRLYGPYRLVVDLERAAGVRSDLLAASTGASPPPRGTPPPASEPAAPAPDRVDPATASGATPDAVPAASAPETGGERVSRAPLPAEPLPSPGIPSANRSGGFSVARQLGLGVSKIVIDPGHGGHDPGAISGRLSESALVLDVALRLEQLLVAHPRFEVVMTRRTDQFVPLEARTALANAVEADLFLSIHANASRNPRARGVETYFLNFATNPEAEAVAARENAASERTMRSLNDMLSAIALNSKLDESRDFAGMVQDALVRRLRSGNRDLRNLGVKQAPFVVLIGAGMPSVLAEISFVTNRAESQLLRTDAYRQRIAQALCDAVLRYRRSLKSLETAAKP